MLHYGGQLLDSGFEAPIPPSSLLLLGNNLFQITDLGSLFCNEESESQCLGSHPRSATFKKTRIVTFGWDSSATYWPWSIRGAFLFILFSLMGRTLSPEPGQADCLFVLVSTEFFHTTNIVGLNPDCCSLFTFLEGSQVEWRHAGKSVSQERGRLGRQISPHI